MVSTPTSAGSPVSRTGEQVSSEQASYVNVGMAERWISVIGGGALTVFAAVRDIRSRRISPLGVIMTLLGGNLILRGTTGHCYIYQASGINTAGQAATTLKKFAKIMTINRAEEDLRPFQQGTDMMEAPTASKTAGGTKRSNAQATNSAFEQGQLQAWNTLKETVSKYAGYIQFAKAPNGRGTEVKMVIEYSEPPAGKLGAAISMLTGKSPQQQITEDLRHFKEMMEAGEIPSVEGQPTGHR